MRKILSLAVLLLSLWSCSKEDPDYCDITPLSWSIKNETPENLKISESDEYTYVISSGKKGGHVIFTNTDKYNDFPYISVSERGAGNEYYKDLIARVPIVKDGEVTGYEIWEEQGEKKFNEGDLSLDYACEWFKIHIKYPVVDIEFLQYDELLDHANIEIDFSNSWRWTRLVLTRE